MRASDRSLDIIAFVSDHFRDIIRRRLSELAGLALITLALLGAIALATWSVQDPSLSHATQKPIHNLLGFPGAIFSDLAMQLLGLAAILLLVPEGVARLAAGVAQADGRKMAQPAVDRCHVPRGRIRLGACRASVPGRCRPGSAALPATPFCACPHGFSVRRSGASRVSSLCIAVRSGDGGDVAARCTHAPTRAEKSAAREVDSDEVERDEADGDHASAWLGMIVHALLSWKARIGRMIRGDAARAHADAGRAKPAPRAALRRRRVRVRG